MCAWGGAYGPSTGWLFNLFSTGIQFSVRYRRGKLSHDLFRHATPPLPHTHTHDSHLQPRTHHPVCFLCRQSGPTRRRWRGPARRQLSRRRWQTRCGSSSGQSWSRPTRTTRASPLVSSQSSAAPVQLSWLWSLPTVGAVHLAILQSCTVLNIHGPASVARSGTPRVKATQQEV